MNSIAAPRGTRDLLPAEAAAWHWLRENHAQCAGLYGYQPIDIPMFEATELFERGTGSGTDVVEKEMYTFTDRGGRSLTLRPEATPGIVRAVIAARLTQGPQPVRVHFVGPAFRYDRPQAGRYRQFAQMDIECIGQKSPYLDAEVIEVGWQFFQRIGLLGVNLKLNTLGDIEDRRRYRAALVDYYTPYYDDLCGDCQRRLNINPLRLLDCKIDTKYVANAPVLLDHLSSESLEYFANVKQLLDAAGISYDLEPRLVRGLDYYTHTTFEFWHQSLQGAQNALGGGGRYDGLAEVLGFTPTPGIGYGLGLDRILLTAQSQGLTPALPLAAEVSVCALGEAQIPIALSAARLLRAAHITTITDLGDRKLERKLRTAAEQARLCIIIGETESAANEVIVRDLEQRQQNSVPKDAMIEAVKAMLQKETA